MLELKERSSVDALAGTTLAEVFVAAAHMHPSRTALVVDGTSISYAELASSANRIAAAVTACRPPASPRLTGLLVSRTATAYAGVLGALLAGDAYVPLNPRFPIERLLAIVEASDTAVVVADARAEAAARELAERARRSLLMIMPDATAAPDWAVRASRHQFLCGRDLERGPAEAQPVDVGPDDGAYLLFTSGSTGQPKGVLIRHRNALAYLRAAADRYRPVPEDRFTQLFDLSFDLSVHDMFVCWGAGAALYCVPESAKVAPRDLVARNELTFWFSVPSTVSAMMRLRMVRPGELPSLRWSLFCGEPLPRGLAEAWSAAAPNSTLENLYGPTEATIAFTAYRLPRRPADWARLPETVPIGEPFPGLQAAVVDEHGEPVPTGLPGELCLGGPQVAEGYWRRADLTAERFAAPVGADRDTRWYRTGDRAAATAEHGFVFLGRTDSQVKISGYRLDLQEVEEVVRRAAGCDCVAALAWPLDAAGLPRGVLVFLAHADASDQAILAACRARLPPYAVPWQLRRIQQWPLNPNGKTDRRALAELARGGM